MSEMQRLSPSADDLMIEKLLADLASTHKAAVAHVSAIEEELPRRPLREMLDELAEAQPERLPWPEDWLLTRDSGQVRACRALWQAALLSCIRSVFGHLTDERQCGTRRVDLGWIGSRDFHTVCALAGLDGEAVESRLRRAAHDPELSRSLIGRATINVNRVMPND